MSRSRTRSTIAFLPLTLVRTGHAQQRDAASRALHAASDHDRCARARDLALPRVYWLLQSLPEPAYRQLCRAHPKLFCRRPRRGAPSRRPHERVPGMGSSLSSGRKPDILLEICVHDSTMLTCVHDFGPALLSARRAPLQQLFFEGQSHSSATKMIYY